MADPTSSVKRKRSNADGLLCPISLALPLDPVTAEDGQIYEREAIEDYIKSKQRAELISPKTRQKMGNRLLPSPLIKTHIEDLIENDAIIGELAEDWRERFQQKKKMDGLLKKAEDGDVEAMEDIALAYNFGHHSFKKDNKSAYKWYEKARCAGSILGMIKVGVAFLGGCGVQQNETKGMMYLGMAEGRGSEFATFLLGAYTMEGHHGLPVDKVQAQNLLEKVVSGSCGHKDLGKGSKLKAKAWLDELLGEL